MGQSFSIKYVVLIIFGWIMGVSLLLPGTLFAGGMYWDRESIVAFWGSHARPSDSQEGNTHQQKCISNPEIQFFMYHYIRDDDRHDSSTTRNLSVTPRNFEDHMKTVSAIEKQGKITLMKGDDFLISLQKRCFPNKRIWIFSSDDGWIDSYDTLAPIASKYSVPFFLGIISSRVGQPGFVSLSNLRELASNPLFTIASHTVNHRELTSLSKQDDHFEICQSKIDLENMIGDTVNTLIYPVGKIGKASISHLKECGYLLAWSTNFGENLNWNHPEFFTINRIRISHDTSPELYQELAESLVK